MRSLVKIAVAGAMLASGTAAYADVALPSTGNGELVLFVRDLSNEARVYARGLGVTMDQLLTAGQITGDPTKPPNNDPALNFADTDTLTYTLPAPIGPDANLSSFLSAPGNYVWTIMGGDNQGNQGTEGMRRYATTAQVDFETTASGITNGVIGQGSYGNLDGMLGALNGVLAGANSTAVDGQWGQAGTSYTAAQNWFGGGPFNENALDTAANFYVLATSGGGALQMARVYKGIDLELSSNGTLSSLAGPGGPEVPLPAAVWLLGSAMVGFAGISRRNRRASDASAA
jgi:hypothetical protein